MGAASREVLKLLIARNALVITRGFRNRNPLELALIAHDEGDTVRALLDAGADPASPNHAAHNMTPLHIAAYFPRQDAAAVLLEAGANPNACGSSGLTPVMQLFLPNKRLRSREAEAAKRNMFCLLRDAGADLNAIVPRKVRRERERALV